MSTTARKFTNKLLDLVGEGQIDKDVLICLLLG